MLNLLLDFRVGTIRRIDYFALSSFLGIIAFFAINVTENVYLVIFMFIFFTYFNLLLVVRRLRDIGASMKLVLIYPAYFLFTVLIFFAQMFMYEYQILMIIIGLLNFLILIAFIFFYIYLLFKKGKNHPLQLKKEPA